MQTQQPVFVNSSCVVGSRGSFLIAIVLLACFGSGCGSTNQLTSPPPGAAIVPASITSTANDRLSEFSMTLTGLTLTDGKGAMVNVFPSPQTAEFLHSNGTAAPLAALNIPQGVYTAAAATVGGSSFTCVTLNSSGGLVFSTFAYGSTPSSQVTVNLPTPITIDARNTTLSLELLASPSATFSSCNPGGAIEPFSINPTFNLKSTLLSPQPANGENGKALGISGRVSSVDAASDTLTLTTPDSFTLSVKSNTSTNFQGVANLNSISAGMFLDLDTATQPDASLLATRIAVFDPAATNVIAGPLSFVDSSVPALIVLGRQQQGDDYSKQPISNNYYSFPSSTAFKISSQFSNVQILPFAATFDGSDMVPGQNVSVFSQAISHAGGFPYTPATTVTLLPQTVNGMIGQVSSSGSFAVYTVNLAPYDLFPTLAIQPGQASLLQNSAVIRVYVDGNTQMMNTHSLATGNVIRFYGLVFNDHGTLRMDCAQINDGVEP